MEVVPDAFEAVYKLDLAGAEVISDYLTWLRRQTGPRPDGTITGSELFDRTWVDIFAQFDLSMRTFICAADIYSYTPPFKHEEQKDRDEKRATSDKPFVPYPDDAVFNGDGISYAGGPDGFHPFDIHRVLSNRKFARETLMRFIDHRIRYWL